MNIIVGGDVTGNNDCELYNVIESISNMGLQFHYHEHGLREAKGIYHVSTERVFKAFDNVLRTVKEPKVSNEAIDLVHTELLESIIAYVDDGYSLMKGIYSKDRVTKEIVFADKWVESIDCSVIRSYKRSIKPYRQRTADIVNTLKHNHARYVHIMLKNKFQKAKGYYIEGINKKGTIVPNEKIHPQYRGMSTAISYNKDIVQQVINFYTISQYIGQALKTIIAKEYGVIINTCRVISKNDDKIFEILSGVAALDKIYFPDEYSQFPQISIQENRIEIREKAYSKFVLKYPPLTNIMVINEMIGDGVSSSWELPYLKE